MSDKDMQIREAVRSELEQAIQQSVEGAENVRVETFGSTVSGLAGTFENNPFFFFFFLLPFLSFSYLFSWLSPFTSESLLTKKRTFLETNLIAGLIIENPDCIYLHIFDFFLTATSKTAIVSTR